MQLHGSLSILWHCLSLGLECKLTFSSPVAVVEFSKFAGILGAALSQHPFLGFEIVQLEFHHFQLALFIVILSKVHLTSHSRMSGSRWVMTPWWLSGSWSCFLYSIPNLKITVYYKSFIKTLWSDLFLKFKIRKNIFSQLLPLSEKINYQQHN